MKTLHHFHGGVHPEQHKLESSALPSVCAPVPQRLTLPLQQHLGTRAKAVVRAGDKVLKGQLLARAAGAMSAAIHAPTSGTVLSVDFHALPHPSGLPDLCAIIEADGEECWIERPTIDFRALPKAGLLQKLRDGGIVGLGGATFPAHLKFDCKPAREIRTLVLNGAECEPWITSDDRLMRERAAEIVRGIEILRYLASPGETLVGIEDNKPQAITAMRQACANTGIEVVAVPTLYPTGGEKQLIKVLTGKEVPSGGYPLHVGVLCSNVATAYAAHRLINCGEPMISRLVTVTGNVRTPQNFEVLLGTPIEDLVTLAGGALPGSAGYILGGPMMGLHVSNEWLPVVKSTNCVIVKSPQLFPPLPPALPCIRCTRCADACPADLQPQELYWFAKSRNFDKIKNYHLFDCIECGACNYVCPSHIPLVQYFRFAKSELRALEHESAAAALARERYEYRQMRIERDKQEKAEKLAQKEKAALASRQSAPATGVSQDGSAQARIQAALERAREQAAAVKPKNMDSLTSQQQAEIAEIEARRAKARELAQGQASGKTEQA